ncbi:hypothetical protein BABINDRAFT_159533 [Babjeviella inositovora NRRL Y-12698]|uniref:Very long-chain fatty acid transport protein n=1 Tax=Babjeviella inositovora NRRL Y-12698 TaxID=984486 RepID=A0A1E3R142_9ASCO|nr:uncharacterized protein BABINDRAFT_159533 [Babjeviella inositovora NRRL Y-12698]ODQ83072.1 hypothetical protein BABINDRAFT_159533 [Babjeviella inositovora NRRL Y-12698]
MTFLPYDEATIVALLAASYLDSKFKISHDAKIIGAALRAVFKVAKNKITKQLCTWGQISASCDRHPDRIALKFPRAVVAPKEYLTGSDGKEYLSYDNCFEVELYTYKELQCIVHRLSHVLVQDGVRAGTTVGMFYTNKPFFVFLWFALWNIGAVPAFINYKIKGLQLAHVIKVSQMSHIYVDPDVAQAVRDSEPDIAALARPPPIVYLDETALFLVITSFKAPTYVQPVEERKKITVEDTAVLIYTSGTTSLPKAAIMNWQKMQLSSSVVGPMNAIKSDSTVYICMPLYHSTGAFIGLLPTLSAGGTAALGAAFSKTTFWTQVKLTEATHILYVGEVMRYLTSNSYHPSETLHNVQVAYGNGLRRDIWSAFKKRFHIPVVSEFYGATETPSITINYQEGAEGIGAVRTYGWLVSKIIRFQQRVVRLDNEHEEPVRNPTTGLCYEADVDELGEMLFRLPDQTQAGSAAFAGYIGNKKATQKKILHNVFRKGDAWFRTGDLMKVDVEARLYFVDRMGDTFRWKSENVSTGEVEAISMDYNTVTTGLCINQCVCVGVQVPNHEGRAGFLIAEFANDANPEQLSQFLRDYAGYIVDNLPPYSRPLFLKVGPIQLTHNHKIAKNVFRNQVLPSGADGSEKIYWLDVARRAYVLLDERAWTKMQRGETKL